MEAPSKRQTPPHTVNDGTIVLNAPSKEGYDFLGWYDENGLLLTSIPAGSTGDKTFTARWAAINYQISYDLDGGLLLEKNPSSYTVEDSIGEFYSPSKEGYSFLGWYDATGAKIDSIAVGSIGDIALAAKWSPDQQSLSVVSNDEEKGHVTIIGQGYTDETISLKATPAERCYFRGWYDELGYLVSEQAEYSFSMPVGGYSLTALFYDAEEMNNWNVTHGLIPTILDDGTSLTYGVYPQSVVLDEALIATLNNINPSVSGQEVFFQGDYYLKASARPAMHNYVFANGISIENIDYWFKFEPIVWDILANEDGKFLLSSRYILDYQVWDKQLSCYETSFIRAWLNDTFYSTAFFLGDGYTEVTEVDNSAESTIGDGYGPADNPYATDNTFDKVFLPSSAELINQQYYPQASNRVGVCSDFVRAMGIECGTVDKLAAPGKYWSRSPNGNYTGYAINFVDLNGAFSTGNYLVCSGASGVKPCINIALSTN